MLGWMIAVEKSQDQTKQNLIKKILTTLCVCVSTIYSAIAIQMVFCVLPRIPTRQANNKYFRFTHFYIITSNRRILFTAPYLYTYCAVSTFLRNIKLAGICVVQRGRAREKKERKIVRVRPVRAVNLVFYICWIETPIQNHLSCDANKIQIQCLPKKENREKNEPLLREISGNNKEDQRKTEKKDVHKKKSVFEKRNLSSHTLPKR